MLPFQAVSVRKIPYLSFGFISGQIFRKFSEVLMGIKKQQTFSDLLLYFLCGVPEGLLLMGYCLTKYNPYFYQESILLPSQIVLLPF